MKCYVFFNGVKYSIMYSSKFENFIAMWRDDFAIMKSIDEKICADKDGNPLPWFTYPAIEYLGQFDYSDKSILEFGCGYSSLFWARKAKFVLALETDAKWYQKWNKEFREDNLQIVYCENYMDAVNDTQTFDVIVIDGKNRQSCVDYAIRQLNDGGIIILDDSDRVNSSENYQQIIEKLKQENLLQVDFFGCCPMNNFTKTTSVFFRRNFNFNLVGKNQPVNGIGNLWGKTRKQRKEFYKNNS